MSTLRWRKNPAETGLARIGAGPRGYTLFEDGHKRYATVNSTKGGWFWVAGWRTEVPSKNTCDTPCADEKTAKSEALAYVKSHRTPANAGNQKD